jgi:hypothetical protein
MRTILLIATACLSAGCYNYRPLTTPAPEPGAYIAVTLSDAGSESLSRALGPSVFVVRGRCVSTTAEGLLVSVTSVETKRGIESPWEGEKVLLPPDAIVSLDERRLAKGRSLLLAGVGAGGLVATTLAFSLLGSGTQPGPGGGRPGKQ